MRRTAAVFAAVKVAVAPLGCFSRVQVDRRAGRVVGPDTGVVHVRPVVVAPALALHQRLHLGVETPCDVAENRGDIAGSDRQHDGRARYRVVRNPDDRAGSPDGPAVVRGCCCSARQPPPPAALFSRRPGRRRRTVRAGTGSVRPATWRRRCRGRDPARSRADQLRRSTHLPAIGGGERSRIPRTARPFKRSHLLGDRIVAEERAMGLSPICGICGLYASLIKPNSIPNVRHGVTVATSD